MPRSSRWEAARHTGRHRHLGHADLFPFDHPGGANKHLHGNRAGHGQLQLIRHLVRKPIERRQHLVIGSLYFSVIPHRRSHRNDYGHL